MNFIRFVKTPRIEVPLIKSRQKVKKKSTATAPHCLLILTITTDFSPSPLTTELSCQLLSLTNSVLFEQIVHWKDTDREIRIEFPVPPSFKEGTLRIDPIGTSPSPCEGEFLQRFMRGMTCHIVGLQTQPFSMNESVRQDTVYRDFNLPVGPLRIMEQSGETIIRHVWDAGIILSAALSYRSLASFPNELQRFFSGILSPNASMRILELGTGVGILGLSIAATFPRTQVVMTDLQDAQPLVEENVRINTQRFPHLRQNAQFRVLDWETRPLPEWTMQESFEMIVMADVTYNTATFAALASTLENLLRKGCKGAKVVCCGKRRHDEEEAFWEIIKDKGFEIERRVVFSMDLDGNFRHNGEQRDEKQLVDFVCFSL